MKNKELLVKSQDEVWSSGKYTPTEANHHETTYCNLAVQAVAKAMGCTAFDKPHGVSPELADEMYKVMQSSKDFIVKPIGDCQWLANEGTLIIAAMPSWMLLQSAGHVCTLTPGHEDYSGHWDKKTPLCLNLGRKGTCFRAKGVNWAFQVEPFFFAWVPSL